jgi:hypothetical protein
MHGSTKYFQTLTNVVVQEIQVSSITMYFSFMVPEI